MTRRYLSAMALTVGVVTLAVDILGAQKGKTPPDVAGSFTMRSAYDPGGAGPDRVSGDGINQGVYAADPAGTRVVLNANREFRAELFGSRYVQLDFLDEISGTLCSTNCFRLFGRFVIPIANTFLPEGPWRAVMQTNVVNSGNVETADGLFGLSTNGPAGYARFFVSFKDPNGRDFHWSILFNPAEYPGTNLARVSRTGPCSWTVSADAATQAGLRAWNVRKGRGGSSDEGRFSMPFGIAFTAPNCGA